MMCVTLGRDGRTTATTLAGCGVGVLVPNRLLNRPKNLPRRCWPAAVLFVGPLAELAAALVSAVPALAAAASTRTRSTLTRVIFTG